MISADQLSRVKDTHQRVDAGYHKELPVIDGEARHASEGLNRRELVASAGILGLAAGMIASPSLTQSETTSLPRGQPSTLPTNDQTTSDILVGVLIQWDVTHVFGNAGDGVGSMVEVLRKRQTKIMYVSARHQEAAAFMASAYAKHSGCLGVCLSTTGAGAVHLLKGLYDAKYDDAPVLAITDDTFDELYLDRSEANQGVDTLDLMKKVSLFNESVNGPDHAIVVGDRAIRAALSGRGVAHLTLAKHVQATELASDTPSMQNRGGRTAPSWSPPLGAPPLAQLSAAADRSFLAEAQGRTRDGNGLLRRIAATQMHAKLQPQIVARALGELAPDNAVYSLDPGANRHLAARYIQVRADQRWSGSGALISMGTGLPSAVAASFLFPDRLSIAVVGDRGSTMLMAELSTAVVYKRDVKVIVFNSDVSGDVNPEQRVSASAFAKSRDHIDFARSAKAVGAKGYCVASLAELRPAIRQWLSTPGVAVLHVRADTDEELLLLTLARV